jgi:hypothetical protein
LKKRQSRRGRKTRKTATAPSARKVKDDMDIFQGKATRGLPLTSANTGHMIAHYGPADGNPDGLGPLRVDKVQPGPAWIDGRYRSIYNPVPAELQDHVDPADPLSTEYMDAFNPETMELGPGNVITNKLHPDELPSYDKLVFPEGGKPGKPGWTQDPKFVDGVQTDQAAKYAVGFTADGDPIWGEPPASAGDPGLAQFRADVDAALARLLIRQK